MNYTASEVLRNFTGKDKPTDALLQAWKARSKDHNVTNLINYLKKMNRNDLVDLLQSST